LIAEEKVEEEESKVQADRSLPESRQILFLSDN
jgi:hypothetical protein